MTHVEPRTGQADALSAALRSAQQGSDTGFSTLYQAIQPGLLRYLAVLVGSDAEDVASETWLHVVRDLHTFHGDGDGFKRWTVTIGRHRALDHLRHHQRRPSTPIPVEELTEVSAREDTASAAMETLGTDAALALIARLPQDQAEAVLLRVVVGLDAESAGQVLEKKAGAVRTAAYRGLRRLADLLDRGETRA